MDITNQLERRYPIGGHKFPAFSDFIEQISSDLPKDRNLRQAIIRELRFIAPRPASLALLHSTIQVYKQIFRQRYDKVYFQGEEYLKTPGSKVFLCAHRSYVESAFMQIHMAQRGHTPPLVLVGDNLSMFPMGYIFRRTGHFFVRRKQSQEVQRSAFQILLKYFLKNGFSFFLFHEGTRTRTGYLSQAKLGAIAIIADIAKSLDLEISLVPTSINCESYIDDASLRRILRDKKKKEGILPILKGIAKAFAGDRGPGLITFSKPISCFELAQSKDLGPVNHRRLANEVNFRIAENQKLPPSQLAALGVLNSSQGAVGKTVLKEMKKKLYIPSHPFKDQKKPRRSPPEKQTGMLWWKRGLALLPILPDICGEDNEESRILRQFFGIADYHQVMPPPQMDAETRHNLKESLLFPELSAIRAILRKRPSFDDMSDALGEAQKALEKALEGFPPMPEVMKQIIPRRACLAMQESRTLN